MTKKALVVEGGGMRGAHSCGALMAFIDRGLTDFDVVVASSAGACTAAYFVSRQFHLFPSIWTEHLHGRRFINLRKIGSGKSVMNLDYLIHELFGDRIPLDLEALRKSPTRFFIAATDCLTGKATYFRPTDHPVLTSLKASAAMPIAYRGPVVIQGRPYVDGGITDPIPIQKAIDEGCTEIFLLLTQCVGYRKKKSILNIIPRLFQKKYPHMAAAIRRRPLFYNDLAHRIETGLFPATLHVVRPAKKLPVGRFTTDGRKIRAAVDQGYADAMRLLDFMKSGSSP